MTEQQRQLRVELGNLLRRDAHYTGLPFRNRSGTVTWFHAGGTTLTEEEFRDPKLALRMVRAERRPTRDIWLPLAERLLEAAELS
jgi:hypothetical protein